MATRRFWVDADAEGEPTVWTGDPDKPRAILRRCEISADEATRDEVLRRLNDTAVAATVGTWRCVAKDCADRRHLFSGWEDGQRQIREHARTVAHDDRWPLTLAFHDATGRQYAVDYADPVLVKS